MSNCSSCSSSNAENNSTQYIQSMFTLGCLLFFLVSFYYPMPSVYISIFLGAFFPVIETTKSLLNWKIDIGFLMLLAAFGAILTNMPQEASMLLFLFALSGTLEGYAMQKMKKAISGLVKLRPEKAIKVLDASKEEEVFISSLAVGDKIKITPYQRVPVDSKILKGSSSLDESIITGESRSIYRKEGDLLYGGSLNQEGLLYAEVVSNLGETHLDKIISLVEQAQKNKATTEKMSDWFGEKYTLFVLGVFISSLLIRCFMFDSALRDSLYDSLVLLVALSPCALVISTPSATLCALSNAAKNGILIRGSSFFEKIRSVNIIAFDKTGTLTLGHPQLEKICYLSDKSSNFIEWNGVGDFAKEIQDILECVISAENDSSHPIAKSLVKFAKEKSIPYKHQVDHTTLPGLGVRAQIGKQEIYIGQEALFKHVNIDVPELVLGNSLKQQAEGFSTVLVHDFFGWAVLSFKDQLRPEARGAIGKLVHLFKVDTMIVSGDNQEAVNQVANDLGISQMYGKLLPTDKNRIIHNSVVKGNHVMMVGDGVNDAPCLAKANVGVAMGGLGSDVTLNAANVVLVHNNLNKLVYLFGLSEKTSKIILTNIIFSSGAILLLTISSFFFTIPLPIAVIGHEGSTLIVIANSLRLLNKLN